MMRRGMPYLRIGITPPPGQNGRAIDEEAHGHRSADTEWRPALPE